MPRAAATAAACDVESSPQATHPFVEPDLSEPCLEALAADFSVDLPLDRQEATALAGAHALLVHDRGRVEQGASPLDEQTDDAVPISLYDLANEAAERVLAG